MHRGSKNPNFQLVLELSFALFELFPLRDPWPKYVIYKAQLLTVLPYFDNNNHSDWKVHMHAFLKSIDDRVWLAIEKGCTKPETPIKQWNTEQIAKSNFNNKALDVIYNAIYLDEF